MNNTLSTYSGLWKVAYPIIIGLVAQNIMLVIDTAFLGQLGAVTLGAAAIGGLFFLCIVMLATGFSVGVQILVGRRNGERKYKQIGIIMVHSIYLIIMIALICFAIITFIAPSLLESYINSDAVFKESITFLDYRKFGLFFGFLVLVFNAFYIGTIKTSIVSIGTIIMAIVNIVLDYGLIFGNLGLPQMGIAGAAIATNIAEFSTFLFYIAYGLHFKRFSKYKMFSIITISKPIIRRLLNLSIPVMFQYFLSFAAWFVFFLIIEKKGEIALASSNIVRSIYMFLMIPVWGLSSSINSLVSNTIGEGRISMVMPLVKKVVILAILCSLVMLIAPLLIPHTIVSFYTKDPAIINAAIPLIYVISVALLAFSVSMIIFSALSGTGKTLVALKIEVICIMLYLISAYILSNVLKVSTPMVWTVEIIYFSLIGIFSAYYLLKGNWKQLKI
ncbi:MAG: MATE family efflux transporter [Bacteroidota bacterium]